jgi:hypothetical protein
MTYLDLLRDAVHKLDKGDITLGEYDKMLEPLKREIQPERKPGYWMIKEGELAFWDVCSECKKMVMHKAPFYNFCPHCGADMRGEKNEIS